MFAPFSKRTGMTSVWPHLLAKSRDVYCNWAQERTTHLHCIISLFHNSKNLIPFYLFWGHHLSPLIQLWASSQLNVILLPLCISLFDWFTCTIHPHRSLLDNPYLFFLFLSQSIKSKKMWVQPLNFTSETFIQPNLIVSCCPQVQSFMKRPKHEKRISAASKNVWSLRIAELPPKLHHSVQIHCCMCPIGPSANCTVLRALHPLKAPVTSSTRLCLMADYYQCQE